MSNVVATNAVLNVTSSGPSSTPFSTQETQNSILPSSSSPSNEPNQLELQLSNDDTINLEDINEP